jgi:hypothetical protein
MNSGPAAAELLAAWRAWEQRPADQSTADRMETATADLAQHVEVTSTQLRDRLAGLRRNGASPDRALQQLLHP